MARIDSRKVRHVTSFALANTQKYTIPGSVHILQHRRYCTHASDFADQIKLSNEPPTDISAVQQTNARCLALLTRPANHYRSPFICSKIVFRGRFKQPPTIKMVHRSILNRHKLMLVRKDDEKTTMSPYYRWALTLTRRRLLKVGVCWDWGCYRTMKMTSMIVGRRVRDISQVVFQFIKMNSGHWWKDRDRWTNSTSLDPWEMRFPVCESCETRLRRKCGLPDEPMVQLPYHGYGRLAVHYFKLPDREPWVQGGRLGRGVKKM
jgi:hypothetical protein